MWALVRLEQRNDNMFKVKKKEVCLESLFTGAFVGKTPEEYPRTNSEWIIMIKVTNSRLVIFVDPCADKRKKLDAPSGAIGKKYFEIS